MWEKKNIPLEVPFYWKMQHLKLLSGSERPAYVSRWSCPEVSERRRVFAWIQKAVIGQSQSCRKKNLIWLQLPLRRRPAVFFFCLFFLKWTVYRQLALNGGKKEILKFQCSQILKEASNCFKNYQSFCEDVLGKEAVNAVLSGHLDVYIISECARVNQLMFYHCMRAVGTHTHTQTAVF